MEHECSIEKEVSSQFFFISFYPWSDDENTQFVHMKWTHSISGITTWCIRISEECIYTCIQCAVYIVYHFHEIPLCVCVCTVQWKWMGDKSCEQKRRKKKQQGIWLNVTKNCNNNALIIKYTQKRQYTTQKISLVGKTNSFVCTSFLGRRRSSKKKKHCVFFEFGVITISHFAIEFSKFIFFVRGRNNNK